MEFLCFSLRCSCSLHCPTFLPGTLRQFASPLCHGLTVDSRVPYSGPCTTPACLTDPDLRFSGSATTPLFPPCWIVFQPRPSHSSRLLLRFFPSPPFFVTCWIYHPYLLHSSRDTLHCWDRIAASAMSRRVYPGTRHCAQCFEEAEEIAKRRQKREEEDSRHRGCKPCTSP